MTKKEVITLCEKAVTEYAKTDMTGIVFFHAEKFVNALWFREYMQINYPLIKTAILCQGFLYNEEVLQNLYKSVPAPQN